MIGGSYQEEPDSQGRRDVEIVSSNAPDKRPDLSTDEGRGKIRAMLDGIEEVFLSDIARGRGVPVSPVKRDFGAGGTMRSEEHTSELQSLMRSSYAVFCLKKNTTTAKRH